MSLASKFAHSTAAFVLAFGFAANTNIAYAASGQPIPEKTCFTSDAQGPANEKLNVAMKARGQRIIITADQAIPAVDAKGQPLFKTDYKENIFTSSLDGSEGYNIVSDAPGGQVGTNYCIRAAITDVNLYNAYTAKGIPAEINKGELGRVASEASSKHGFNVMMTAKTRGGALVVVSVDTKSKGTLGDLVAAQANGEKGGSLAHFGRIDYSPLAKQALGIKTPDVLATYSPQ